jgi:type IV secretion system protein VirB4
MLRFDKVIKPWKESAALNDHINLYGFWNETTFLTKSGDLGIVLSISGVDYESLDRSEQEYAVKRLEAALKAFGSGFHVYQYLFKSNRPDIPFASYDNPIVEAAIDQRRKFFEAKRDHLYQVEILYCILLEGTRSKTGVRTALARLLHDPKGAIGELKSQFTNDSMKTLMRTHIERDLQRLDQHVQAFARQLADFMQIEVLNQQNQFRFFRRLLNYDDSRIAGRPQSTQFLDYQVVNSDIEAERDHLRVGDYIVRVLTMKEDITETRPLVLDALLKISANFYVVTEWTPLPADRARKEVNSAAATSICQRQDSCRRWATTPSRRTRAMCWWTSPSKPTSKILGIAFVPWVTVNRSATSRSRLSCMVAHERNSISSWPSLPVSSRTRTAICSRKATTSSTPISPLCRATMQ